MSGGGELAAVFQARRKSGGVTIKKAEVVPTGADSVVISSSLSSSSSSSSGELAAIFKARKQVIHGDGAATNKSPPRPAVTTVGKTTPSSSPSASAAMASPPKATAQNKTKNMAKLSVPSPTAQSATAVQTPMAMASPVRNETLTAKFESRDLKAGIPTPGFLQDARKSLRKPGEKKNLPRTATKAVTTTGGDETENASSEANKQTPDEGEGVQVQASSSSSTKSTREQSHQDLMAARRSRMVASRSANKSDKCVSGTPTSKKAASTNNFGNGTPTSKKTASTNNFGNGTPTNKKTTSTSSGTPANKAGKSKSLDVNTSSPTQNTKTNAPTTPLSVRREKLRARARAMSSSTSSLLLKQKTSTPRANVKKDEPQKLQTAIPSDEARSPDNCISTPSKDEFGLTFFDTNNPGPAIPDLDSNSNDQYESMPKPKFELRNDSADSLYKDLHASSTGSTLKTANNSSTSSVYRDCCRANTPKINGSQHSVYDLKGMYEENKHMSVARPEGNPYREIGHGSSDPFHITQPYQVSRTPSQGSQMSAITTPSCFPPDTFPVTNGVNKPILEAIDSFGNSGSTSKSEEMIQMREQMKKFKKKLEEKDAIISQLMKRISDLEQGNPNGKLSVSGYQQQPPPRSSNSGKDESASAFSSPKPLNLPFKMSNNMSGQKGRKPFDNLASQSFQSVVRSTEKKKFAC